MSARWLRSGVLLCLLVAGCSSGPVTVRRDRFNFNDAGAESTKEQILLNIIRLRYGESLYFVDIGTMVNHYSIGASAGLSGHNSNMNVWNSPALRAIYGIRGEQPQEYQNWDANLNYTDSPTISYSPLTGEEFSKRVMAPIPPATIIALSESGWSVDRVLDCCVQRINDVRNKATHEMDEPAAASDSERFSRLSQLLKTAQDAGFFRFGIEYESKENATYLYSPPTPPEWEPLHKELEELLGLPPNSPSKIRLTASAVRRGPDEVAIQTRSLLGVMYALAQDVPVPCDHVARGEVSTRPSGDEQSSRQWMRIEHSRLPQVDPFVQVFYNGYWFYINKCEWSSKRTFALLTYLFSLQSSLKEQSSPVLTLPAGG